MSAPRLSAPKDKSCVSVSDLVAAGLVAPAQAGALAEVEARYSVALTPEITALIDPADPADPIARQFLPDARELSALDYERADPIGDGAHETASGVVHRYKDRVLLKLVGVCPIYCRFCFRRESVGRGKGEALSLAALDEAFAYIGAHPEIFEVILTGGDPLALSARRLADVAQRVKRAPHVALLRVHTRVPTMAPALLDRDKIEALASSGKALHVVLHVNHARELSSAAARDAIALLRSARASLLAQSVLLAGVNDSADALEALMRALIALQVKPYYLHHPDLAPGTAHFRLSLDRGRALYAELARRVSGVALPAYVIDIPGGYGKAPVNGDHVYRGADGVLRLRDRRGDEHIYPEG